MCGGIQFHAVHGPAHLEQVSVTPRDGPSHELPLQDRQTRKQKRGHRSRFRQGASCTSQQTGGQATS